MTEENQVLIKLMYGTENTIGFFRIPENTVPKSGDNFTLPEDSLEENPEQMGNPKTLEGKTFRVFTWHIAGEADYAFTIVLA